MGQAGRAPRHRLQRWMREPPGAGRGCWTPKLVCAPLHARGSLQWCLRRGVAQDSATQTHGPCSLREGHRARGAVPVEGMALGAWTHHPSSVSLLLSFAIGELQRHEADGELGEMIQVLAVGPCPLQFSLNRRRFLQGTTRGGWTASSRPDLGRCPGEGDGSPLQYSCLGNPMGRGAWRATVHRVTKSQTQLKQLSTHRSQTQPAASGAKPTPEELAAPGPKQGSESTVGPVRINLGHRQQDRMTRASLAIPWECVS